MADGNWLTATSSPSPQADSETHPCAPSLGDLRASTTACCLTHPGHRHTRVRCDRCRNLGNGPSLPRSVGRGVDAETLPWRCCSVSRWFETCCDRSRSALARAGWLRRCTTGLASYCRHRLPCTCRRSWRERVVSACQLPMKRRERQVNAREEFQRITVRRQCIGNETPRSCDGTATSAGMQTSQMGRSPSRVWSYLLVDYRQLR